MYSTTRTTFKTALCLLAITVVTSPVASVYFSPMMSCQKFCQMLTKDYVRRVWCVIDVCKKSVPRRRLAAYPKRSDGTDRSDSGASGWADYRLLPSSYDYYMDKRGEEFWTDSELSRGDNNVNTDRPLKHTV